MERHGQPDYLSRQPGDLPSRLRQHSTALKDSSDLDPLIERIGDARIVMLGEATHGTSEFYRWRAKLSQRLIEEEGFSFVAVEGDWPASYELNRFIKGYDGSGDEALDAVRRFHRWPTWMWANWEMVAFVDWMRRYNVGNELEERIGFFGLDVYSLKESLGAVLEFVRRRDPEGVETAYRALECFEPHGLRGQDYARAVQMVDANCEQEVVDLLAYIQARAPQFNGDYEGELNARQNARVLVNAERYYRTMLRGGPQSWNLRDRHMSRTLDDLLAFHGPNSRAIVWEHNTHVGDAHYTDMRSNGMINLGQLGRENHGEEEVVLVGFGTHRGHVIAGSAWGASMQEMKVPAAMSGSWEDVFHQAGQQGQPDRLLLMDEVQESTAFLKPRGHRAIGVVYREGPESAGQYVPTILPRRYDAFIFIDATEALHPLHIKPSPVEIPETYPWGM